MERMRHIFFFLLAGLMACSLPAQKRSKAYEDYIHKYRKIAVDEMKRYRVPASITLAQGLLESGAGKSQLAPFRHQVRAVLGRTDGARQ